MAVPGNPLCTACWQSIRVRSGSRKTRSCCVGLLRLPEAASRRRSRDERHASPPGRPVEPRSATTNHPDMASTQPPPWVRIFVGPLLHMFTQATEIPLLEEQRGLVGFPLMLHSEQCKADDCGRYPRLAGMWPGTSRKRSRSGPSLNPPGTCRSGFPFSLTSNPNGPFDVFGPSCHPSHRLPVLGGNTLMCVGGLLEQNPFAARSTSTASLPVGAGHSVLSPPRPVLLMPKPHRACRVR